MVGMDYERKNLADLLASAVNALREVAALKGTSKRQGKNSEIAANWLIQHGYPLEEDGYLPGKGFPHAF